MKPPDFPSDSERLRLGDDSALGRLFERHHPRLRRMVQLRLDQRLRGRVDPSDVIQETNLVANRDIDQFLKSRKISFRLWLRETALQRLIDLRRKHVVAQRRSFADRRLCPTIHRWPSLNVCSLLAASRV